MTTDIYLHSNDCQKRQATFSSPLECPQWLSGKESAYSAGAAGSIPGSGRSPGAGNVLQIGFCFFHLFTEVCGLSFFPALYWELGSNYTTCMEIFLWHYGATKIKALVSFYHIMSSRVRFSCYLAPLFLASGEFFYCFWNSVMQLKYLLIFYPTLLGVFCWEILSENLNQISLPHSQFLV